MNKGDTLRLILDFPVNGKDITQDQFDELELQINPESFGKYFVKLLKSKGELFWSDEFNKYVAIVNEENSFKLSEHNTYQLRCYKDGAVISSKIGHFDLGNVLSKTRLSDGGIPLQYNELTVTGGIEASSTTLVNVGKWGSITGDILDQQDLMALFDTKENTDIKKISEFFGTHPEYDYRFLISIDNKELISVRDYIQLIIDLQL